MLRKKWNGVFHPGSVGGNNYWVVHHEGDIDKSRFPDSVEIVEQMQGHK